ncbi:hypothetical protein LOK49_LG03G02773 [Camellia lanceoleosa]|uniref:Uncharacterized protein n=1 Tax=Camellia lanceoleosa TaxID=1840588 RepID=A0ACC0I7Z0_9ERIC|nr:hypothetical protein LOK49_LG03G02773 [Camellia lanceoleosa]
MLIAWTNNRLVTKCAIGRIDEKLCIQILPIDMCLRLAMKASIHHNILLRLLDKTFDEFASLWMNMKVEVKTKEDHEARQFKFKPRRTVDGIAHGVISLTRRISDINGMAQEFPTLSNTTGLVRLKGIREKERDGDNLGETTSTTTTSFPAIGKKRDKEKWEEKK